MMVQSIALAEFLEQLGNLDTQHRLPISATEGNRGLFGDNSPVRGCPKTFDHHRASVKQPSCGNETQGGHTERACSA
jgi:hypothetical protein